MQKRVLCVSSANWLGVSRLPNLLTAAGARVTLLAHPNSLAARSRRVDAFIPGSWSPAETIERLRVHLEGDASYDWVLIADDPTMVEAVRRRGESWIKPCLPVDPDSDKPQMLTNKAAFFRAATAAGLPVPRTRYATTAAGLRVAALELGFPVLIKPSEGSGGSGVFTASGPEELDARLPPDGDYVAQSFIPGRSGGTAALFDGGRPVWWFSSLRARVWPEPYGPSCQRLIVHPPEIPTMLERLGAMLGLRGLVEFEWILPEGGAPLIIEMNPRPPPYIYLDGSALTAGLRAFLAGGAAAAAPRHERDGDVAGMFPEDVVRAAAERDWRACARWLTGRAGPVPWDDPALLWAYARLVAKAALRI